MKLSRVRDAFPWRVAVILALVLCLPLLAFWAWFRWELPPLQRLSRAQRKAVDDIFLSREKIVGLDGVVRARQRRSQLSVKVPSRRDTRSRDLRRPLARRISSPRPAWRPRLFSITLPEERSRNTGEKRLYVLDESSLASTRQMHEFIERLHRNDRVLLVGDSRQHEAVEAGRPFAQLQEAGMRTATLDDIVRQRDPELKQVVEQLARGQVGAAVESLDRQGRVHEVKGNDERIAAIAREYAKSPDG